MTDIRIKRIYEPVSASDGERVLVDGFWPCGFTREDACIDEWAQEVAPSTELRRWFGQEPTRFAEFRRRYVAELAHKQPQLTELRKRAANTTLTLVYAARHTDSNNAVVLAEVLQQPLEVPEGRLTGETAERLAADRLSRVSSSAPPSPVPGGRGPNR